MAHNRTKRKLIKTDNILKDEDHHLHLIHLVLNYPILESTPSGRININKFISVVTTENLGVLYSKGKIDYQLFEEALDKLLQYEHRVC